MTTSTSTVRIYRGCNIYPRNRHGYYETYVGGSFFLASTLAGMRETIRAVLAEEGTR